MLSLSVKQQQTNIAQVFASGRHLGTCALVCVCDCVFWIYVQVTTLRLLLYNHLKYGHFIHNLCSSITTFKSSVLWPTYAALVSFFTEYPIAAVVQCIISAIFSLFYLHFTATNCVLHLFLACVCVLKGIESTSVWVHICLMLGTNLNLHQ